MPMPGNDLDIKRPGALFHQRIDCANQRSQMNRGGSCVGAAQLAIKIPKINACRQSPGAFALDVFTDVVFAGIKQAVAVFTLDIEQVGFFQALVPAA